MNKKNLFLINNLWWLIPLFIASIFWKYSSPILLMLVFSYIARIILNPLVILLNKWIKNRKVTVSLIISILFLFFIILSSSLFPLIKNQIINLQSILTMETLITFQNKITFIAQNILPISIFNLFYDIIINFNISISSILETGLSEIKTLIGSAGALVFNLGSFFISFLIFLIFLIFFLIDGDKFVESFLKAIPKNNYKLIKRMLDKTSKQIHVYIRGQLLAGLSVAITSIIGLYLLQWITEITIPYTILIGLLAGFFNLIPFIGPIMGLIPALIIYLITEQIVPIHLIYIILIILVFAIVQMIDNFIMSPYIMGSSVGMHPMFVIILVLFGAAIGGILGMLFIVPIAAIIKVIIEELVITFK